MKDSALDLKQTFDAIIIGTGPGGGTLGYALAKKGFSVLFVEKGALQASDSLKGNYAEIFVDVSEKQKPILKKAGRYYDAIFEGGTEKTPFIGCGVGGSTALFGMVMERFFPCDFAPRKVTALNRQSTLPAEGWPFKYEEILPYYESAERMYGVKGIGDLLRKGESFGYNTPPPLSQVNQELVGFFKSKNLNPYVLPRSCEFVDGCMECQGFLYPKNCKNDAYKVGVKPAIAQHGAYLLTDCEVLRLESDARKVTGVVCYYQGKELILKGQMIFLAAGAIATPALLLQSANVHFPNGLANHSGEVGRNLMRHCTDMFLIKTKIPPPKKGLVKEIAFNDLYAFAEERLGTLQSFGRLPPGKVLFASVLEDIKSKSYVLANIVKGFRFVGEPLLEKIFARKLVLATILEDLPYHENTISLDKASGKPIVTFKIFPYEKRQIDLFRKKVSELLKPYSFKLIRQAENNERLAHACGTCRAGNDPKTSVVDKNCKAHDLENLYIVDTSFFPTSGGTNPALTVAANALRVADTIS